MRYRGTEWTLKHTGLSDDEFKRLIDLDAKEADGTLSLTDRWELSRLLAKMRRASDQEQSGR